MGQTATPWAISSSEKGAEHLPSFKLQSKSELMPHVPDLYKKLKAVVSVHKISYLRPEEENYSGQHHIKNVLWCE